MFYKFIELSRSFVRCGSKCQRFSDRSNFLKDVIGNAVFYRTSTLTLKSFLATLPKNEMANVLPLVRSRSILFILANELRLFQGILKENTIKVTKSCLSQFEFVLAHRVRRAQQVFSLYSKLWDDKALTVMISRLRKQFMLRGRAFMFGLTAAAVINWDEVMIKDHELTR